MASFIKINPSDNVGVALRDLRRGESALGVTLRDDIPSGHKFTLEDLPEGADIIKYGFPIGHLTREAAKGSLVDHSCIRTNLSGQLEYKYEPSTRPAQAGPDGGSLRSSLPGCAGCGGVTFKGFRRADGQCGIRNQIWIIPTVGCVNGVAEAIASRLRAETENDRGSVDAIVAFPHNYGCSQLGDDHENTRRILADMVHHPNAGGVLIVSLGCENNQLEPFMDLVGPIDGSRVKTIKVQEIQGDEIEAGLVPARQIFEACRDDRRSDIDISELRVGLKCGGSDGLSGITANPLLGVFSDWLTALGGTTVLTEVPEMFGAETILMKRCRDKATFDKTVALINDFKSYFERGGQPVYENPSPGNKAGGISTLEEKSLGCTQKCGSGTVQDVLPYGGRLERKGLNLLSAPGNDLVASTALAAAGCQLVLFTTGRGTPFGSLVPTLKISSNTPLSRRKPGWIDFDAGVIAEREAIEDTLARFISLVLETAGGSQALSERQGFREIAIFKSGVTL